MILTPPRRPRTLSSTVSLARGGATHYICPIIQKVLGSSPVRPYHTQSRQVRKEAAVSNDTVRYRSAWPLFYFLSPPPVALFGALWSALRLMLSTVIRALDLSLEIECLRDTDGLALAPATPEGFVQHIDSHRGTGSIRYSAPFQDRNRCSGQFLYPSVTSLWTHPPRLVSPPAVFLQLPSRLRRLGSWAHSSIHEERNYHQRNLH